MPHQPKVSRGTLHLSINLLVSRMSLPVGQRSILGAIAHGRWNLQKIILEIYSVGGHSLAGPIQESRLALALCKSHTRNTTHSIIKYLNANAAIWLHLCPQAQIELGA